MSGATGHHGTAITLTSDPIPGISGAELRDEQRGTRVVYMPLFIRAKTPAEFHYYFTKLRKSIIQMTDHQLWVTNEEGATRVLYCRYQKGFDTAADDDKSGLNWKFMGLYVEAMDPFFYDPPGSEISRIYSPDPWSEDFLTFTVNAAITADAAIGDTRIKVQNTTNFVEGKAIDILGTKILTSDDIVYSDEFRLAMKQRAEGIKLGTIPPSPADTVVNIATDNANPQVGQMFHITGTVATDAGKPVTGQTLLLYATGGIKTRWNVSTYTGNGKYSFTIVPDAQGAYTFQVRLLADEINYHTSWSNILTVNTGISGLNTQTSLTLQASATYPPANTNFTLSGTLLVGTSGLANQKITLYKKSPTGKVAVSTTTTNKSGNYAFTRKEPAGWVDYEADFAGFTSITYEANAITTAIESISSVTQIINQTQSANVTGSGNVINFAPQIAINTIINNIDRVIDNIGQAILDRLNGKRVVTLYNPSSATLAVNIGDLNYPINYWAALPPSMIGDGEIQYFGYHSYNGIICIAEASSDNYATELGIIKNTDGTGNGLNAAIDISVVTDNVKDGSGNVYPLSHWSTWLASLYTAGWRLFCGVNSTGRSGDPAYIAALGSGAKYVNFSSTPRSGTTANPDTYGANVDHNSFQLFRSAGVPYIQAWTIAAYLSSPSIKSGVMAGIWADDDQGINEVLTNEDAGDCPDYRCLLDWSYINQVGMTNFVAWFHPKYNAVTARDLEGEQVTLYESLGFPAILTKLRTAYAAIATPAWHEPTQKAVRLTYSYTDVPMIFSGALTKLTSGAPIAGGTITLQELVGATWTDSGTDVTAADGSYSIEYLGATGQHQLRVKFAEQTISGTTYMQMIVPTPDGISVFKEILIYYEAVQETNQIKTVVNGTILELVNPTVNNYLAANECYVAEYDLEDSFLTPDEGTPRTLNDNCNIVIFWMRGCPPCYTAKEQLKELQATYNNIALTFVEIQDAGPSDEGDEHSIGMTAAKMLYPEAYAFHCACGPPVPPPYGAIDALKGGMPATIAIYRDGLYVQAFCGVHTTGVDPVSSDVLADTCGPKLYWRVSASSIGLQEVIVNNGEITTYPIWTIAGPGTTPTITNVTTGECFELDHELIEGEAVVIDSTDFAHTVAGTKQENYTGAGYMKSTICPTCQGKGVIAASCVNCGGLQVCPTCHGSGVISVWVPASTGTTLDPSGMYNLRFEIDEDNDDFWGFAPNANVIQVELGNTKYGASVVNMQTIQRYDGI